MSAILDATGQERSLEVNQMVPERLKKLSRVWFFGLFRERQTAY